MRSAFRFIAPVALIALVVVTAPSIALAAPSDSDCIACHTTEGMSSKIIDGKVFGESAHKDIGCVGCHDTITDVPHAEKLPKVNCGTCHEDAVKAYGKSYHGQKHQQGDNFVASCVDCHSSHAIFPSKDSRSNTNKVNVPKTCARCHEDQKVMQKYNIPLKNIVQGYQHSVHGRKLLKEGNLKTANCVDCHSYHDIQPPQNEESTINRKNIPTTCGKCHVSVSEEFKGSVHGVAVMNNEKDAPTCDDCHGEHFVRETQMPQATGMQSSVALTTCTQCHGWEKLNTKYNIPTDRLESYYASYHGMAAKLGDATVANCASCHGIHNIRNSKDPLSRVNKDNLAETCGQKLCHPGATANFTKGKIHVPINDFERDILNYIKYFYILVIIGTLGGMLAHNMLDFYIKMKVHWVRHKEEPGVDRFNLSMRIQHVGLLSTFIILAFTGFALKYSDSFIAYPFMLIDHGSAIRSWIHRIAAIIFILVSIYHVFFLLFNKRGRAELVQLFPTIKDAKDAVNMMLFYIGMTKEKPKFYKYGYVEKAEYWALIWGSIVMIVTGLMLWFLDYMMMYVPKFWIDAAEVVHLYEAILATLAIIVWHLYHVLFNPTIYPVSLVFLTGKMPLSELKHEHTLEYEELKNSNTLPKPEEKK